MFGAMRLLARILVAASTVVCMALSPTPSVAQGPLRTLVVLLAHADDETAAINSHRLVHSVLPCYAASGADQRAVITSIACMSGGEEIADDFHGTVAQ
jgi:hypothetical protein